MAMPADSSCTQVLVVVGPSDSHKEFRLLLTHVVKAGGLLANIYRTLPPPHRNHYGQLETAQIHLSDVEVDVFERLCTVIIYGDQCLHLEEVFRPTEGRARSWMYSLIDVYQLADRLASDYVQNKIMDSLMTAYRDAHWQALNTQPLTWTLSKFRTSQQTRSLPLASFLIDLVAFNWLTEPHLELKGETRNNEQPTYKSPLDVFVKGASNDAIKRLMFQVIQQQARAKASNLWCYENPANKAFCNYHVHRRPLTAPCPGGDF